MHNVYQTYIANWSNEGSGCYDSLFHSEDAVTCYDAYLVTWPTHP